MGLATYQPRTTDVSIGEDNSVSVRGLSFNDVVWLFDRHSDDINSALGLMGENADSENPVSDEQMLVKLVGMFPDLVASITARSSGEEAHVEQAKALPFPTQLEVCLEVIDLTFREVGGTKKFMAMVGTALQMMGQQGKIQVPQALNTG